MKTISKAVSHLSLPTVLVALLVMSPATVRADAPPVREKPAELKVLERFVGKWDASGKTTILDGKPVNITTGGPRERKWGLGGWFIDETGKDADGTEFRVMFGVNPYSKMFLMYFFTSNGIATDAQGTWDEKSRTFTFHKDHGNGMVQDTIMRFVDDDTQEWQSVLKDAQGSIRYQGSGKATRKKK